MSEHYDQDFIDAGNPLTQPKTIIINVVLIVLALFLVSYKWTSRLVPANQPLYDAAFGHGEERLAIDSVWARGNDWIIVLDEGDTFAVYDTETELMSYDVAENSLYDTALFQTYTAGFEDLNYQTVSIFWYNITNLVMVLGFILLAFAIFRFFYNPRKSISQDQYHQMLDQSRHVSREITRSLKSGGRKPF